MNPQGGRAGQEQMTELGSSAPRLLLPLPQPLTLTLPCHSWGPREQGEHGLAALVAFPFKLQTWGMGALQSLLLGIHCQQPQAWSSCVLDLAAPGDLVHDNSLSLN